MISVKMAGHTELECPELLELSAALRNDLNEDTVSSFLRPLLVHLEQSSVTTSNSWTLMGYALQSSFIVGGRELGDILYRACEDRGHVHEIRGSAVSMLVAVAARVHDPAQLIATFNDPDWISYFLATTSTLVAARINSPELMEAAIARLGLYESIESAFARVLHRTGTLWSAQSGAGAVRTNHLAKSVKSLVLDINRIAREESRRKAFMTLRVLLPEYTSDLGPRLPLPMAYLQEGADGNTSEPEVS